MKNLQNLSKKWWKKTGVSIDKKTFKTSKRLIEENRKI